MSQYNDTEEIELDLKELFFVLWKKAGYIFLITLLMGIIGFFVTKELMTDIYQSSGKMIVNSRTDQSTSVTNDQITSSQKLVDTYAVILRSRTVLQPIIDTLNLGTEFKDFESFQNIVSVSSVNGTQVMEISAEHKSPQVAHDIVKLIIEISPEVILDSVEAGSVKTIEYPVVANKPIKPSALTNTLIMALLGGVISVSVILMIHIMDNTIKNEGDIERFLMLPTIGVTPKVESCQGKKGVTT